MMSNPLLRKLEKWCPTQYDVHWDPSILNQPPRFKLTTPNLSAHKLNKLWAEVVSIVTNSNYIVTSNYIRVSTIYDQYTIATSIFPTGCIMFQGSNVLKWLDRFIVRICRKVNTKINDPSLLWSKEDDEVSPEFQNEITVEGFCMICNGRDNGEMLLCENPQCCTWSHAICEGFTEENLPKISPYLCPVCANGDISKQVVYFDSSESSYDSSFSEWIDKSSELTTLENASHSKSDPCLIGLPPAQMVDLHVSEDTSVNVANGSDSFKNVLPENPSHPSTHFNFTEQNDTPPLESQNSPIFKQTVSTPKNKSSNRLFCGNTSPIFSNSDVSQYELQNLFVNKTVPKNWMNKWHEIRSTKKHMQLPISILAKEKHPNCTKNPFSPVPTVRQKLLPVLEMTEFESEPPSLSPDVSLTSKTQDRAPASCNVAQPTPLRKNIVVEGGRDSKISPGDPLSSILSEKSGFQKNDSAVPSEDKASTTNLTKHLQERVCKLLEEKRQNQNTIHDQSINHQKMQAEIENLTETLKQKDEIICSIYKNNHEEDRIKYFKNMDPDKLIRNHIKLQNMYHTLKFLYDDALKMKDSFKQQLNLEKNQKSMESENELETIKYDEILKKYEKIKAEQLTTEKQKSELIEKLKQQKEEIKMLELLCEKNKALYENNKNYSEESIEVPCPFIYESSQNDSITEISKNESIQEIKQKIYTRKTIKLQNTKIFYKKGFDPMAFEQSRNIYAEFKRRVKEELQLNAEDPSIHTTKPLEGVEASQVVAKAGTAGSPAKTKPSKKRIQNSPRFSNKKSNRQICWYYLHNMCKFGNQCRNKHKGSTDQPNIFKSQKNFTTPGTKSNKKSQFSHKKHKE